MSKMDYHVDGQGYPVSDPTKGNVVDGQPPPCGSPAPPPGTRSFFYQLHFRLICPQID